MGKTVVMEEGVMVSWVSKIILLMVVAELLQVVVVVHHLGVMVVPVEAMKGRVIYINGGRLRRMVETGQMILLMRSMQGMQEQVVAAEEQVVTIMGQTQGRLAEAEEGYTAAAAAVLTMVLEMAAAPPAAAAGALAAAVATTAGAWARPAAPVVEVVLTQE